MYALPDLNDEEIARQLKALRGSMSILQMERESGVSRQVLYRIMGGTSINRSPYEIVVKVLALLQRHAGQPSVSLGSMDTISIEAPSVSA